MVSFSKNNPPNIGPDIRHESMDMHYCINPNEHNDYVYKHFTVTEVVLFVTGGFTVSCVPLQLFK